MADAIADRLAEITANLDAHIEAKATAIATARITAAEDAAEEKITGLMARHAAEVQRLEDLVAELRRQMKPLVRHIEVTCPETKERRARIEVQSEADKDVALLRLRKEVDGG